MTKRLEELFDLPRDIDEDESPTDHDDQTASNAEQLPVLPETLAALDKIEAALPAVRGLEASDSEMDALAAKASESFDDLMNLGMQVDSRYSSEIFAVASTMLGHAITAKTAKMNKKLRMIDLQMKKLKLDREGGSTGVGIPTAEGTVLDRNELLRRVLETQPTAQNTDAHKYTKES
jgi:hypothetical protein